jgi:hypothetical protein
MPEKTQHDEVFGDLIWDALLECWLGGIDWPPGLHTEVAIWEFEHDKTASLPMAREGLAWLKTNEEHVRRCIANAMLELYNEVWRDEPAAISQEEFMRRLELMRFGFEDDGSLLLSYDCQDMFGGHVIDGRFGADRSFHGAHLIG